MRLPLKLIVILLLTVASWVGASVAEPLSSEFVAKVVGGTTAAYGAVPWQVGLFANDTKPGSFFCGGTLIDSGWVLTAAHCFTPEITKTYVLVGTVNRGSAAEGQFFSAKSWHLHPDYNPKTQNNDIALIRLASSVDFDQCDTCAAIRWVTPEREPYAVDIGTVGWISGWGVTRAGQPNNNDALPYRLQLGKVYVMDCLWSDDQEFVDGITDRMFCAGTNDFAVDSCVGDSGGPLVVSDNEGTGYVVAGIVSWGKGCAMENPGVYTRIASYDGWIRSTISPPKRINNGGSGGSLNWLVLVIGLLLPGIRQLRV